MAVFLFWGNSPTAVEVVSTAVTAERKGKQDIIDGLGNRPAVCLVR